jgi:hypothetical protein
MTHTFSLLSCLSPACLFNIIVLYIGVPCTCLVTDTAPQAKITAIESYGATIQRVPWDELWKAVESRQHVLTKDCGALVHPFDDDRVCHGILEYMHARFFLVARPPCLRCEMRCKLY